MINRCVILNRPGSSPVALARAAMRHRRDIPRWPQFTSGHLLPTATARAAIAAALDAWGVGAGDEIIAPAYNCGSEIDVLFASGATVRCYDVDPREPVDVAMIEPLLTPRTRVVYVTHYFGWVHPVRDILDLCRRHGVRLLEDAALSLFAEGPEGPAGTVGDAAVYSFTKTLGVPDGGALVMRRGRVPRRVGAPAPARLRARLGLVKRWGQSTLRVPHRLRRPGATNDARPDLPPDYRFRNDGPDIGASPMTLGLLQAVTACDVRTRRRTTAAVLLDHVRRESRLEPVFTAVTPGACPLAVPVLAPDRASIITDLVEAGVAAHGWWSGYHPDIDWDAFPKACRLKDEVLVLPCHHALTATQIDALRRAISQSAPRDQRVRHACSPPPELH